MTLSYQRTHRPPRQMALSSGPWMKPIHSLPLNMLRHNVETLSTLAFFWEESTGHQWISSQRASDADVCFCSYPEKTGEQTFKLSVIWDAMMFIGLVFKQNIDSSTATSTICFSLRWMKVVIVTLSTPISVMKPPTPFIAVCENGLVSKTFKKTLRQYRYFVHALRYQRCG